LGHNAALIGTDRMKYLFSKLFADPEPRLAFQRQAQGWKKPSSNGLDILHQGLLISTEEFPHLLGAELFWNMFLPLPRWLDGLATRISLGGLTNANTGEIVLSK